MPTGQVSSLINGSDSTASPVHGLVLEQTGKKPVHNGLGLVGDIEELVVPCLAGNLHLAGSPRMRGIGGSFESADEILGVLEIEHGLDRSVGCGDRMGGTW